MNRTGEPDSGRQAPPAEGGVALVETERLRGAGYDGSCLRPLGLCELGGSCDICWYSPHHPRFNSRQE